MDEIAPWRDCDEPVDLIEVAKKGGGVRPTLRFGLRRATLNYLCLDVLKVVWGAPLDEFNWRGRGSHRAVRTLRHFIRSDMPWVGVADVKNCFPSFRHEGIQPLVPLPNSVFRNVILMPPDVVILGPHGIQVSESDRDTLRRGLPAGAPASGFIASHILGKVLAPFGQDEPLVRFSDNLAWPRSNKADAVATLTSLQAHLSGHPVGELTLHNQGVHHTDTGVSFVGYHIVTDPAADTYVSWAFPEQQSFSRFRMKLKLEVPAVPLSDRVEFVIARTTAWLKSWCEWDPTPDRIDAVISEMLSLAPQNT